MLPERPIDGHKGTFGHVYVIGGARGYTGAIKMASLSAARSGAGLVTAGIPESLAAVIVPGFVEVMSHWLPSPDGAECLAASAAGPALEFAADKDAVVLGPGIGRHEETKRFVLDFVAQCDKPMVIDADGLNAISHHVDVLHDKKAPIVLTPHPGEMARLAKTTTADIRDARERVAADFASRYGCTVVLKGHATVVADPSGDIRINTTGNAGMATGGTGDVLSGLIGGLLAQGVTPEQAAALGAFVHGLAGDLAASALTQRGMIASDLISYLPAAWRALEQGA
jgi:NAD(P)H-hydrate epimerase